MTTRSRSSIRERTPWSGRSRSDRARSRSPRAPAPPGSRRTSTGTCGGLTPDGPPEQIGVREQEAEREQRKRREAADVEARRQRHRRAERRRQADPGPGDAEPEPGGCSEEQREEEEIGEPEVRRSVLAGHWERERQSREHVALVVDDVVRRAAPDRVRVHPRDDARN